MIRPCTQADHEWAKAYRPVWLTVSTPLGTQGCGDGRALELRNCVDCNSTCATEEVTDLVTVWMLPWFLPWRTP